MNRHLIFSFVAIVLISSGLNLRFTAQAKENEAQQQAARAEQAQSRQIQAALQAQQIHARQAEEQTQQMRARQAQEQEFKIQQEEARKTQEQEIRAQVEAHRNLEQNLRAQEESARKNQEQMLRAQQEGAHNAQQQALRLQQRETTRREQEQELQVQNEARNIEAQNLKAQQEATHHAQQEEAINIQRQEQEAEQTRLHNTEVQAHTHSTMPFTINRTALVRPISPRPLKAEVVPLQKAISMPILEENVTAEQQAHAQAVAQNLQTHLIPVQANQAPSNISTIKHAWLNQYTNNYQAAINGQPIYINRENTQIYPVPRSDYPYWYQPEPNWIFSNGFCLGSTITVGLDWLRSGWHPYYGPPPEGFICARDFIPTPWVYVPAYSLWRQPGMASYAVSGPDYDYTGPITVEVLEPRHVHVRDPFTGWEHLRVINVVYLYNAYFYPEYDRWGYMNRNGYFVWLNL